MNPFSKLLNFLLEKSKVKKDIITPQKAMTLVKEVKEEKVLQSISHENKEEARKEITPLVINSLTTFLTHSIQDSINLNSDDSLEGTVAVTGVATDELFAILDISALLLYTMDEESMKKALEGTELESFHLKRNSDTAVIRVKDVPLEVQLKHGVMTTEEGEVPVIQLKAGGEVIVELVASKKAQQDYLELATTPVVIGGKYKVTPREMAELYYA